MGVNEVTGIVGVPGVGRRASVCEQTGKTHLALVSSGGRPHED